MNPNCYSLLENLNEREKQLRALTFYQGHSKKGVLTYGELLLAVDTLSGYLKNDLKIVSGDRILVLSPNRLEIPILLFALWRLGAVAVPLNPHSQPEDWDFIAQHSKARGAFVAHDWIEKLGTLTHPLEFKRDISDIKDYQSNSMIKESVSPSALAIILYTSGTTGNPKGVALSQSNLTSNGMSMAVNFGLRETHQFAVLPLYHAHALGFGLMSAFSTRGHLIFTDKLDPFSWMKVIEEESVVFTSVVPSLLPLLLAARVKKEKVSTLKCILVSSAPLSTEVAQDFETKTGIPLVQGWGLSEYTNFACCISPELPDSQRKALLFHEEGTSVGSPLEGTEVKVIDGELCVRGPSLMLGYYGDESSTTSSMTEDGWLKTGDQGFFRLIEGKPAFFVTARIKEIIIRGGEKYSPLAIEKKIFSLMPELRGNLVVVGFSHLLYGEEVGAYLQTESLSGALRERLGSSLEKIAQDLRPKVVICSAEPIPRTHTGKIQRRKLQPLFSAFKDCKGASKIVTK